MLEQLRMWLSAQAGLVAPDDRYRILDSAPIPLCTYLRSHECRSLLLGTLTVSFHLERPGSRSWQGFVSRTSTQLLGYTLCSLIAHRCQSGNLTLTPN